MPHNVGICRQCGLSLPLSSRGLCAICAQKNIEEAIKAMKERKGAIYKKWKKNRIRGDRKV